MTDKRLPLLRLFGATPVDPKRAAIMSRIRGRDTGPERKLRQAIWARGARFRTNVRNLPGRPDIANQRARVAVFVDGCFWHGCPRHYREPKTRVTFWREKVSRNLERRERVRHQYSPDWLLIEVFECQVLDDLPGTAGRIASALLKRP